MKKDFLPVKQGRTHQAENEFIEEHWTDQWRRREVDQKDLVSVIGGSDQFRLLNKYLDRLSTNSKVVDGGCGLGLWTRYVADSGFEAVGLDISRDTIARLQTSFPQALFFQGDIRKTAFPDNHFELYYSWGVFEHFEEGPERCFQEAARILESGGYLLVSVPFQNRRHSRLMRKPLQAVDKYYDKERGYETDMRFYQWRLTQQELEQQMVMAGFDVIEIVPIEKREGIHRALLEQWPSLCETAFLPWLERGLEKLLPVNMVSHMIFAAAQKR